jgi:hypothetical protein
VQLPSWGSPDLVQELIKRFSGYLCDEFGTMLENWTRDLKLEATTKPSHAHNPSLQSVMSAITNASNDSAESNWDNLDEFPYPFNEERVLASEGR